MMYQTDHAALRECTFCDVVFDVRVPAFVPVGAEHAPVADDEYNLLHRSTACSVSGCTSRCHLACFTAQAEFWFDNSSLESAARCQQHTNEMNARGRLAPPAEVTMVKAKYFADNPSPQNLLRQKPLDDGRPCVQIAAPVKKAEVRASLPHRARWHRAHPQAALRSSPNVHFVPGHCFFAVRGRPRRLRALQGG
jgi:hypothetical protein